MRVPPVDTPSTPKTSPMLTGLDWLVPLDFVTVFACASLVVRASSAASATAVAAFATTAKRVSNTSNTAPIKDW